MINDSCYNTSSYSFHSGITPLLTSLVYSPPPTFTISTPCHLLVSDMVNLSLMPAGVDRPRCYKRKRCLFVLQIFNLYSSRKRMMYIRCAVVWIICFFWVVNGVFGCTRNTKLSSASGIDLYLFFVSIMTGSFSRDCPA